LTAKQGHKIESGSGRFFSVLHLVYLFFLPLPIASDFGELTDILIWFVEILIVSLLTPES
jgi:hypothetical protein